MSTTERAESIDLSTPTKPVATGPVIATLACAGIVMSLAQTLVVPLIGILPGLFDTSVSNASWIITITLLTAAVATPVLGRLADMYGKKRILQFAIVPFLIGSVLCALSGTVVWMIIGRGLQGLSAGIVPIGISLLHDVLPREKVGSAVALMSSSMGIGGALGLPIAAAVAQFANWRVLFWGVGAVAVITMVAVWLLIPASSARGGRRSFDVLGAVGLAVGLVPLLLAVSKGAEWGWTSTATIAAFAIAVIAFVLWGWYELRRRNPLVDLRITATPVVLMTNVASLLVGFAMYAMNLIVPQVMQLPVEIGYGMGQSMLQMGLWMAPMGFGMIFVSKLGARLSQTRGPKNTLAIAGVVIAIGYGAVALILGTLGNHGAGNPAHTIPTLILLMMAMVVTGCGVGFGYGSMPALIMGAVPNDEKAAANSFNALMRSLGVTASSAIIGAVLGSMSHQVGGYAIPDLSGMIICLLIGCGGALVAAAVAVAIPSKTATD